MLLDKRLSCASQCLFGRDMHWATLSGQYCFAQGLAERWVRMDGFDDLIGCKFATHGQRVFGNQVRGVWPNDMGAQHFVVFADDDLREPIGFGDGNSLSVTYPCESFITMFRVSLLF